MDGNSFLNVVLNYDLGVARPGAYFGKAKVAGGLTNKVYILGITAPMGGGRLKASYTRLTPDSRTTSALGAVGPGNGVQAKFGVGYDYFLSKRTNIYADFGTARKDGTVGNAAGGATFSSSRAYAVGVKHTF